MTEARLSVAVRGAVGCGMVGARHVDVDLGTCVSCVGSEPQKFATASRATCRSASLLFPVFIGFVSRSAPSAALSSVLAAGVVCFSVAPPVFCTLHSALLFGLRIPLLLTRPHPAMGKRAHFRSALANTGNKRTKASMAPSPFDTIRAKAHHPVLNASTRGTTKQQLIANQQAINKRKQSLLSELKARDRHNEFADRRIGQHAAEGFDGAVDSSAVGRDVMAERFAKERMRQRRGARGFQLDEPAEDAEQLTHEGQALSTVHFPTLPHSDDEADDRQAGRIDADDVHALHFGGGTDPYSLRAAMGRPEAGGVRSKKEVMDEIILKSKVYKAEKAHETQVQADRVQSLDTDFSSIRSMLAYRTYGADKREDSTAEAVDGAEDGDDFVKQTHMLAEEVKVKAAERVKTADEAAKEEKERMERMERARLRRMRGEDDEEEDEHNSQAAEGGSRRRRRREQEKRERREEQVAETERKKRVKTATDDDLVENYIVDKESRRQQRMADIADELDEEGDVAEREMANEDEDEGAEEDGDEDEDEDEDEDGDEHEEDEELEASAAQSDTADGEEQNDAAEGGDEQAPTKASSKPVKPASKPLSTQPAPSTAEDAVPYIFPAPTSHRHLQTLLAPYPATLHPLIYRRMQQYHFLALTADNRGAMEVFTAVLLTHFHSLVKLHTVAVSSAVADGCAAPLLSSLFAHLDCITCILADLVQVIPSHVAAAARQLILTFSSSPPAAHNAALFTSKLLLTLFPSSDARHNVVTPVYLWLASSLTYAPAITSAAGLVRQLLCCQLVLAGVAESKRFVPEVLNELWAVLLRGWAVDESALGVMPVYLKHVGAEMNAWQRMGDVSAERGSDGWKVELQTMFVGDEAAVLSSPSLLCSLFALMLRLVTQASALYSQLPSHPELFTPFYTVLQHIAIQQSASLPPSLAHLMTQTCSSLSTALSAPRPSFASALPSAPTSIRQHTPAYIDGYQPGRDYDPVKERAEARELTRKMKRERRGAEKEIRKDAEYVRAEETRERDAREEAARTKRRHAFADMERQAADTNLLHKASKKKNSKSKK